MPVCDGVGADDGVVVLLIEDDAVSELLLVIDKEQELELVALEEGEIDAPVDHEGELDCDAVIVIEAVTFEELEGDVGLPADSSQQNGRPLPQDRSL